MSAPRFFVSSLVFCFYASFCHGAVTVTGGSFSDDSIWDTGTAPANSNYTISAGDTVTATGVTITGNQDPNIFGTFNVNSGSTFSARRVNNGQTVSGGILNINTGGSFTTQRFAPANPGDLTVNVNDGGSLTVTSLIARTTININPGGVATLSSTGATEVLQGGTLITTSSGPIAPSTWNTGTFVTNTSSLGTATEAGNFASRLSSNGANLLDLSNQGSKQIFSVGRSSQLLSFNATDGIIEFNVYSSATDDSDLMAQQLLGGDFDLSSDVLLRFEDFGPLGGAASDYLGVSYQLFDDTNDYADIVPTLDAAVWNIGGLDYDVTFTNNLALDGSLVVSNLVAVIPEPSGILILLAGASAALFRRRRGR